jgi:hypothetical protein
MDLIERLYNHRIARDGMDDEGRSGDADSAERDTQADYKPSKL